MRIEAIGAAFPERIVSNREVIDSIRARSEAVYEGDLKAILKRIEFFLGFTGSNNRRWIGPGESAFAITEDAVRTALARASVRLDEVDVLIHASVDRRVVEPGQSFFIAKALGMKKVECFDVLDACNSWTRAARLADAMLRAGTHKRVLVVTSEFASHEGEWSFDNFTLARAADLDWSFPSYTMGEAATATLFVACAESPWTFDFETRPDLAHLCMCPVAPWDDAVARLPDLAETYRGPRRFVSHAKKMHDIAWDEFTAMLKRTPLPLDRYDVVFPHTQAKKIWDDAASELKLDIPYYYMFPEYGNVVASSIPAAMFLAERDEKLARGARVAALMTAAGVSYGTIDFVY